MSLTVEGQGGSLGFAFFFRELGKIAAGSGTTVIVGLGAFRALDEEDVTGVVGAVDVGVGGRAALVALGDYLRGDTFAESVVDALIYYD